MILTKEIAGMMSSISLFRTVLRGLVFLFAGLFILALPGSSSADQWDETLAKAKKEGVLVAVLGGSASRNYRPVFKYFENKYGIRTVVSTGGGRRQADRLLAERGAGKYKVDVVLIGGGSANTRFLPNNVVDPIGPELFLPEVVDQSLWYGGTHRYSDPEEKYVFAFSANAELTPIGMRFNTNKLPIKEAKKIDSVWTFLDKRFAGQIVALPPTASGALGTYFTVMVHPDLGEKFLRRMFRRELNVQFSSDFRQIADGVARGKYTMAIFVGSAGRDIDRLGRQGLPVASFTQVIKKPVKERPIMQGTGASNNVMVVNRRPHPYAARLFVNWLLSKEGQTIMQTKSERVPDQSFRVDVTEQGKVEELEMRKPGIE
ncbi:MAG: extracellular solute-binding protein, partial [Deltaproteobacteria bacterium]|nr:extracellular solute-binding protein [Deltaproteobacteria bacterium]